MKHVEFLTGDRARDQRNVDLLLGAVEQMHGGLTPEAILTSAVDSAIELTHGERGALVLADESGGLAVRVARKGGGRSLPLDLRLSQTAIRRVMTTGRPALEEPDLSQSVQAQHLRCVLVVPLRRRDQTIGVLYVDSQAITSGFTPGDLTVFETLAALAVSAIERHDAERRRHDLESARDIQLRMAPRGVVAPKGFDVAFEGRSTEETGGDYHDAIPLADGTLALVVGDVSGHGLPATLYMTAVRAALRTILRARGDPVSAISDLNAYLCTELHEGSFVSLFLGVLDPIARTFRWVSAGHSSVHVGAAGAVTELTSTGPVLGVLSDATYRVGGPIPLAGGDAVVLYTDGIYEAQSRTGEMYGEEERLLPSIAAHVARVSGASALLDGILRDFRRHVGDAPVTDDVTCVVLRALPPLP